MPNNVESVTLTAKQVGKAQRDGQTVKRKIQGTMTETRPREPSDVRTRIHGKKSPVEEIRKLQQKHEKELKRVEAENAKKYKEWVDWSTKLLNDAKSLDPADIQGSMKAAAQKLQKQIQKQPSPPREPAKEQPKEAKEPSPPRKKPIKVTLEEAPKPVLQPGPGVLDRARQKLAGESKRSSSSSQGLRPEEFEEL